MSRVGGAAEEAMKKSRIRTWPSKLEVFTQFSSDLDEMTKGWFGKRLMELLKHRPLSIALLYIQATHKLMLDVDVKKIKTFQMDALV